MIASLLVAAAVLQGPDPVQESPAQLVSRMLAKHAQAQTMVGSIRLSVMALGQKSHLDTEVQYERPSKLYIRQVSPLHPRPWLVVSDGSYFSYDVPTELHNDLLRVPQGERLVEKAVVELPPAKRGDKPTIKRLTIADIYAAASRSIKDRSVPLDIAIGRLEDLQFVRDQWATLASLGKAQVNGVSVHVLGGNWRAYGDAPVSGTYELCVGDDGSLVRYVLKGTVAGTDPNTGRPTQAAEVVSVWDVSLKVNAAPDGAAFVLPKKGGGN